MYGLSITLPSEEDLQRSLVDEAFHTVIHRDRSVQTEPVRLEGANSSEIEELSIAAAGHAAEQAAAASRPAQVAPSSGARRSEAPSPVWPLQNGDDDDYDDDEWWPDTAEGAEGSSAPAVAEELECVTLPFYSGQPSAELGAGCVRFFRFEHPPGVVGLRPPPLRSNLIGLLDIPAVISSAELLSFLGAYLPYVRHMRLVRDASRPAAQCLLLQFGSPAHAERFRRDVHGKRYNSLESDVVIAVHLAQVAFGAPQPAAHAMGWRVQLRLHVRDAQLQRGFDGGLQVMLAT